MCTVEVCYCMLHIGTASTETLGRVPIKVLPSLKTGETSVTLSRLLADKGPVKTGGEAPERPPDELTFITDGLPPIPTKVVQKIEKGEYVDFTDLLPKKPSTEEPTISELAEEGIVVVTQSRHMKGQKKPIQDIATWVEAFLTFATVRNRKYPAHTNDLLAYGALVVRGARDYKGPGWLSYDFQYRRLAAARGNFGDWGKKDVSLWSDTVCKQEAAPQTQHPRSSEPLTEDSKGTRRKGTPAQLSGNPSKRQKGPSREKQWKSSVCFPYSYAGKCSREKCDFLHVCYDCGGQHAQIECPKKET